MRPLRERPFELSERFDPLIDDSVVLLPRVPVGKDGVEIPGKARVEFSRAGTSVGAGAGDDMPTMIEARLSPHKQCLCYALVRMPMRALLVGLVLTLDLVSQGGRFKAAAQTALARSSSLFRSTVGDGTISSSSRRQRSAGWRLAACCAEGLIPVFPSKTFPNHYSIVTGQYPTRHGILSNNIVDEALPGRFSLSERDRWVQQDTRWWGGEPIWVTAERQGQATATMFWPGSDVEIAGRRPRTGGCSTTSCQTRRGSTKCSSG